MESFNILSWDTENIKMLEDYLQFPQMNISSHANKFSSLYTGIDYSTSYMILPNNFWHSTEPP